MRLKHALTFAASTAILAGVAHAQLSGGPTGSVTLHDGAGFTGTSVEINGPMERLTQLRFNDKASSITINEGVWEVCADSRFRGRCQVIDASVRTLRGLGIDNNISSIRPASERPAPTSDPDTSADGPIVFYEDDRFRGRSTALQNDTRDLSSVRFNDRARSVRVNSGVWQVCSDANFRGECAYIDGDVRSLGDVGLSRQISSARLTPYEQTPDKYAISLFNNRDFGGEFLGFDDGVSDLSSYRFNDTAGSVLISSGTWLLCTDADFRGRCEVMRRSEADLGDLEFSNMVTSFRRYDRGRDGRYGGGGRDGGYTGRGGDTDGYGRGRGGAGRGNGPGRGRADRGFEGEQSTFYPTPVDRYGDRIRNGAGQATAFCRSKGHRDAGYKANSSFLSDVVCR